MKLNNMQIQKKLRKKAALFLYQIEKYLTNHLAE